MKTIRNRSFLVILMVIIGLFNNGGAIASVPGKPANKAAQRHSPMLETTTQNEIQLLGNLLGSMRAVAVQGDYAFVAQENALFALSISSPNHPRQLAQPLIFPGSIVDMQIADKKLYLAAGSSGIFIVDISSPFSIHILGNLDTPGNAQKIFVNGRTVFVADGSAGLREIDVSDASLPVEIGSFVQQGTTTSVAVAGDYAYITMEQTSPASVDRLYVLKASDSSLAVQGSCDFQGKPEDIAIKGAYAYIGAQYTSPQTGNDDHIRIIDISNPAKPSEVGSVKAGIQNVIKISGNTLYIPGYVLSMYDLSNPTFPQKIGLYGSLFASILNVAIQGNYAYLATDYQGFRVLDIQNPKDPYDVGKFLASGEVVNGQISGGILYAYSNGSDIIPFTKFSSRYLGSTLWAVNIQDRYQPRLINAMPVECDDIAGIEKIGNLLYVACTNKAIKILDVSDLKSPVEIANVDIPVRAFTFLGNSLYLADSEKLYILDTSNPASPVLVASKQNTLSPNLLVADGHYLYLGKDFNRVQIMDVSDPQNITEVSSIPLAQQIYYLKRAGNYLYELNGAGFQIIDATNINNPIGVFSKALYGVKAMMVKGETVYLAGSGNIVMLYDTHVPSSPQLIATYFPPYNPLEIPSPDSIILNDDVIFLLDGKSGMPVYRMTQSTTTQISPVGGEFSSQVDLINYFFPSNVFSETVDFTHIPEPPFWIHPDSLHATGIEFENSAVDTFNRMPVQPDKPYTLTVSYQPSNLGPILEDSLGLYFWNGHNWKLTPNSRVDFASHQITAQLDYVGRFAVMGNGQKYFLPLIASNLEAKPAIDLNIDHIEITQAVQDVTDSTPLVANRPTFMRVHVRAQGQTAVNDVKLMIQATRGGVPLPGSPVILGPWSVFSSDNPAKFGTTYDYALPNDWLSGEVNFQFNLDYDNSIAELDEGNNSYTFKAVFNEVPALDLKIVPINYTHTPTGDYIPGQIPQTYDAINEMFPISKLNVSIRDPIDFAGDLTKSSDMDNLLDKITSLKKSDNAPSSQVYYGVIPHWDDFYPTTAGLGWIGKRASIGFPDDSLMAHEIGHNFGRKHAPCGVDNTLDSQYPYADALIGQWGFDYLDFVIIDPNLFYDFMSYCGPAWVSDYTYKGLYQDQINHGLQLEAKTRGNNFFIRAAVTTSGTLEIKPLYILPQSTADVEEPSDYSVEMLDASGEVIAVHTLPIYQPDMSTNQAPSFFVRLPIPDEQVSRLRFRLKDQTLAEYPLNSMTPRLPKTLTLQPSQDNWVLQWGAPDVPAMVRYSTDQGITWTTLGLDITGGELILDAAHFKDQKVQFQVIFSGIASPSNAHLETTYDFVSQ